MSEYVRTVKINNKTAAISNAQTSETSVAESLSEENDFEISDSSENVIAAFKNGHIKTKRFDSANIKLTDATIDASRVSGLESAIKKYVAENLPEANDSEIRYEHNYLKKPYPTGGGKTLLAFGDSITAGVASGSNLPDANSGNYTYIKTLADRLGMTLVNKAVSGATATDTKRMNRNYMYDQIAAAPQQADLIWIAIGVNDWDVNNASLGTIADSSSSGSFYGALKKEFGAIKEKYPNAPAIVLTPINTYWKTHPVSIDSFRKAEHEVALLNGFSVIQGQCVPFPEKENGAFSNAMLGDRLHPTRLGHKIMGETLASIIL